MHRDQCSSPPVSGVRLRVQTWLAALAIAFAAAGLASCSNPRQPGKSAPTPEEKAYLQNLQFTTGRVDAAKNFLNHTVTTFHSQVTNKGKKTVIYIEINLTFSDIDGKPIEQKKAYPISGNTLPLKPGETRPFQVSFDQVPALWNQAPPQITPARVVLAGE
jgi:hypothetical protein